MEKEKVRPSFEEAKELTALFIKSRKTAQKYLENNKTIIDYRLLDGNSRKLDGASLPGGGKGV